MMTRTLVGALLAAVTAGGAASAQAADPLPGWNDGAARRSIVAFVETVARQGGPGYVPPAERIAVFDNDGCLWSEQPSIPPEQVVGSSIKARFELREGKPVLVRLPEIDFVDDGAGKPVGIQMHIGRRPIAAFGNSDGDLQMLQWTAGGSGSRFCLYVHHTDAEREWAYDRQSSIGRLDKGLDEARARGWTVVDMKTDWKRIYPISR
jgi:hypothetical protein